MRLDRDEQAKAFADETAFHDIYSHANTIFGFKAGWDHALESNEVQELKSELQEQCRINGMGAQRELKLMTQVQILTDAFNAITKNRYGAQSYIEEDDIKGECNYWAGLALEYQNIARNVLKSIKTFGDLK